MKCGMAIVVAAIMLGALPVFAQTSGQDLTQEDKANLAKLYAGLGGSDKIDQLRRSVIVVLNYESSLNMLETGGLTDAERDAADKYLRNGAKGYVESAYGVLDAAEQYSNVTLEDNPLTEIASQKAPSALATAQERRLLANYGVPETQLRRLMQVSTSTEAANVKTMDRRKAFANLKTDVRTEVEKDGLPSSSTALRVAAAAVGIVAGGIDLGVALGSIEAPALLIPAKQLLSASLTFCVSMWGVALHF